MGLTKTVLPYTVFAEPVSLLCMDTKLSASLTKAGSLADALTCS